MNNLAGPITGWTGLIEELLNPDDARDAQIRRYLSEIEHEAANLMEAASTLEQTPIAQPVEVGSLLGAMLRNVKIQYHNIDIVAEIDDGLPAVIAVYSQLSNALWNLISNALDAMPDGGILTVTVQRRNSNEQSIEIRIQHLGIGIAASDKKKIFEVSFTTKGPGRGYGLWRTKLVVEEIGGSITFESAHGIGTVFTVILPASPQP